MASFEKNQSGKWSVRFRVYEDGKTKNKRLSGFGTKKEAEIAYTKYMATAERPPKKSEQMSLRELFESYCAFAENRVKESTLYDMRTTAEKHILPYFDKFKNLTDIKKLDILKWQNRLNELNLSYKYKSKIRTYLVTVWKFGQRYYDVETDPISGVESFRRTEAKKEMLVWTEEEFKKFIDCVDDIVYRCLFSFLFMTGCRKGEALALRWKDIDLKNKTARIEKSITRRFDKSKHPDAAYLETTPKNIYSVRTVDLPQSLCDLLYAHKWCDCCEEDEFVFGGAAPLPNTTIARAFEDGIKKSGVKKIRIHDLRHSHASMLISKGLDIVSVAKRLGHANIEETLNTYAHFLPQNKEKILNAIEIKL